MVKEAFAKIAESMKRRNVEIRLECGDSYTTELEEMLELVRKAKEAYPSAKVTMILGVH